jgi:hypothetical protein
MYDEYYSSDDENEMPTCDGHRTTVCVDGRNVCSKCAIEIIDFKSEAEWSKGVKGATSSHHARDNSKCKVEEMMKKSGIRISKKLADLVQNRYSIVTSRVQRGDVRKACMAVCLWYVSKEQNEPFDQVELCNSLNITQRDFSEAKAEYKLMMEDKTSDVIDLKMTVEDYFKRIELPTQGLIDKFLAFFNLVTEGAIDIKRSSHSSIIPASLYIFISKLPQKLLPPKLWNIDRSKFSSQCKVSEVTIDRLCKSIEKVIS